MDSFYIKIPKNKPHKSVFYNFIKMIFCKKILFLMIFLILTTNVSNWYFFGLKSSDDTIENIKSIEKKYNIDIPIAWFIFDGFDTKKQETIKNLKKELWKNRIYHITISPKWFSSLDVSNGKFDKEYRKFFEIVKEQDIKIIFRTMHEMNGWRYSWSQDPISFKKARVRIWNISREIWLDNKNILFDFSVNHWDVPLKKWQKPWKSSDMFFCDLETKKNTNCLTREDFYPGRKYVDIIWFTFYNWWKASYDRLWIEPYQILNDPRRKTLERLKYYKKPLFVDEVWTTAVRYDGFYDQKKSIEIYKKEFDRKNNWLKNLSYLLREEKQILGAIYFNCDFTNGLQNFVTWEADWSVLNIKKNKEYFGIYDLFKRSKNKHQFVDLLWLFGLSQIVLDNWNVFVPKNQRNQIIKDIKNLKKTYSDKDLVISKLKEFIDIYYYQSSLEVNLRSNNFKKLSKSDIVQNIKRLEILLEIFEFMK